MKEVVLCLYGLAIIFTAIFGCLMLVDIVDRNPLINFAGLGIYGVAAFMFVRLDRVCGWAFKE